MEELLWDALQECGVSKFTPAVDSDYRTADGVADRPRIRETDDAGKDGLIAAVLAEGYRLELADGSATLLVPATVEIFKHRVREQ